MRHIRPTGFGIFLWLIGLFLISLMFTSSGGSGLVGAPRDQWISTTSYALDSVSVSRGPDGSAWSIQWPNLLITVGLTYLIAAVVASYLLPRLKLRRPVLAYSAVIGGLILAGTLVGLVIGKSYWGYWFERPAILSSLAKFAKIEHVGNVKHNDQRELVADVTLVGPPDAKTGKLIERYRPFRESIEGCREDEYYCLDARILVELNRRDRLPTVASVPSDLHRINLGIRGSGLLARAEPGYGDSDLTRGVLVDGRDAAGRRLVVLGLRGRQASNDHYPYYELAFSGPDLALMEGNRFFYDVAGMEGAEWYSIGFACAVMGLVGGLPIFTGLALYRARSKPG